MSQYPIIIGISGASGACYGIKALELLKSLSIETHLILTKTASFSEVISEPIVKEAGNNGLGELRRD